jgi:hypothetical protein
MGVESGVGGMYALLNEVITTKTLVKVKHVNKR